MRKWLLLGILVSVAGLAAGCATVTKTGKENQLAAWQAVQLEFRMIADDWNLLWMTDRPTRLTRWETR